MEVRVNVMGLQAVLARLDRNVENMRRMPRGEVYVAGERAEVAAYHVTGAGAALPERNPFFLDRLQRTKVTRRLTQGVREINAGLSSGMKQAFSDATKEAAVDIRGNLERERHGGVYGADLPTVTKMAKLSKRYAAWKATAYPGKGILQATGKLLKSITYRVVGG
jgi:hypothetical protein